MSEQRVVITGFTGIGSIGLGVMWAVWGHYGFWWGLLYGLGWVPWVGYRMAEWLLR